MPWKIEESNEPNGLDGIWIAGLAGLKELFLGFKDEMTPEEWRDIRLIAAAPDSLAACKLLIESERVYEESGDDDGEAYRLLAEATEMARAVIRAIAGEEGE